MLTNDPVMLPMQVQPLGGGPVIQAQKPNPMDQRRTLPVLDPSASPQPLQKPAQPVAAQPMPKPPAKSAPPQSDMPQISAPNAPTYMPMQPGVREIQGPSFAWGQSSPPPTFTGAQPYSAQQGSVGQIQPGFSPSQFSAQQISANYTPQGGPQIGELP